MTKLETIPTREGSPCTWKAPLGESHRTLLSILRSLEPPEKGTDKQGLLLTGTTRKDLCSGWKGRREGPLSPSWR